MALLLSWAVSAWGQGVGPGVLTGQIFTAQHPDSVLGHSRVDLVFMGEGEAVMHRTVETDHSGVFTFAELDTTSSLAYVLRIQSPQGELLSDPIFFPAGQETIVYNVMARAETPPLPTGHPPVQPTMGTVPRDRPPLTLLIVALTALLFAFFFNLTKAKPEEAPQAYPPNVRSLMRDVAGLDLRFERGEIGGEEYEKIRRSLRDRLMDLVERGGGSAGSKR
jgi:hypothetical protein